jgi:hypothetical protein
MAGNIRNARTTHPSKQRRRERAAERFSVNSKRAATDNGYRVRKLAEADALMARGFEVPA